ncbi:metal-sulfur cluster assembly factor [Candidatus Roizmanbacteria bacterium]|nr:metal-sulfur cluster assembly factor [Candidatus Roizmanbacteria bacterium]
MPKITTNAIKDKLAEVLDPELNISIVDLGLIYKVDLQKSGRTKITMTLTTIGCPLFSLIQQEAKSKLKELGLSDETIEFELTFDPPWSMDKISERAKAMLGI